MGDSWNRIGGTVLKQNVKIGDVFAVSLGNGRHVYGQIVANSQPKCYVIFDYESETQPDLKTLVNSKIVILTYTVDVFIEDGDWKVIGNIEPSSRINFPEYIIETSNGPKVMDYMGKILRCATPTDIKNLGTQKSVSPKVLELAIKAKFGTGEWYPTLNTLLYQDFN